MFVTHRNHRTILTIVVFFFLFFFFLQIEASARVGGGRSSGSRGSRSFTPPRSYAPPKTDQPPTGALAKPQPQSPYAQPAPQPYSPPQSSFMRGLAGGMLGGVLGGMLFRGLGFGGNGGETGGGIGFFEILLIGGLLYLAYRFFVKKRKEAPAYGAYESSNAGLEPPVPNASSLPHGQPAAGEGDPGKGLGYIRQMDASFDKQGFQDLCMDYFFKIQAAWASRDLSGVRNILTEEMQKIIEDDIHKLKLEKRINKLDNIAVRSVDIVEAWQESGRDYITVKFYANLLDYTVDQETNRVVSGSKTEPVKFEEYWTVSRPVGNNPWQLAAIQQVE